MPSGRRGLQCVLSVAALLISATAAADTPDYDSWKFSVSPFVGYRLGGSFKWDGSGQGQDIPLQNHGVFAVAIDMSSNPESQYELIYSRESTSLGGSRNPGFVPVKTVVEYLQIGGTVLIDDELSWLKPYFGGAIGGARLSPGLAPGREDTQPSISLALGFRTAISSSFSLRFETRGYFTPIGAQTSLFCRSDQAAALCEVRARGSSFFQGDFLAGATFTF